MFAGNTEANRVFESNPTLGQGERANMAENTTSTTSTTTTTSKPAAKKPAGAQAAARKRKPAARRTTTRSTTATTPSKSTGRRVRTQARNETREAAQANARAARITAEQGSSLAERAALSYVGATLEARDRVIETATSLADTFGSRKAAERELKKLQSRYERRGVKARNQLERDVKKARTRLERVVRRNRNAVERDAARRDNVVTEPALERLQPRRGGRPGRRRRHAARRHARQGPHRRAGVSDQTSPARRRRGDVAGKPAGLISRRRESLASTRRVQHLSSLNRRRALRGAASVVNGLTARGVPHAHLRGAPDGRAPGRAVILPRATWT